MIGSRLSSADGVFAPVKCQNASYSPRSTKTANWPRKSAGTGQQCVWVNESISGAELPGQDSPRLKDWTVFCYFLFEICVWFILAAVCGYLPRSWGAVIDLKTRLEECFHEFLMWPWYRNGIWAIPLLLIWHWWYRSELIYSDPWSDGGRRRKYSNKTLLGVVLIRRYISGVRTTAWGFSRGF